MDLITVNNMRQAKDVTKANAIGSELAKMYPGYTWSVCYDSMGGVIKIIETTLMQPHTPYVIRMPESIYSAKRLAKMVMIAGGEILERFGLPRARTKNANDLKSMIPRNFQGHAQMDKRHTPNWCK